VEVRMEGCCNAVFQGGLKENVINIRNRLSSWLFMVMRMRRIIKCK